MNSEKRIGFWRWCLNGVISLKGIPKQFEEAWKEHPFMQVVLFWYAAVFISLIDLIWGKLDVTLTSIPIIIAFILIGCHGVYRIKMEDC